jgi:hypothetical protein
MKKLTAYFIAFAITLTAGAFYHISNAQVTTDDGGSTAGSETSNPSTDDGGSTAGEGDNDSSSNGSSGGGSSSGSRSSRTSINVNNESVTFSDINLSREATNSLRVSWTTSIPTYGRVVFGESSIVYPTIDPSQYYGYDSGSAFGDDKTTTHTAVMFLAPGSTYYIRLIASTGDTLVYGPEISAIPVRSEEAPRSIDISPEGSDEPAVIDLSKLQSTTSLAVNTEESDATSTPNPFVAAVGDAGRGIGRFFSDLWGMLFGRICK